MMILRLLLGLMLGSGVLLAEARLDSAVYLELNRDGIHLLAEQIAEHGMEDISDEPLPDFEDDDVGYGVEAEVQRMRYWVDFESLSFEPREGGLSVIVRLRDVRLHAARIKMRKRVLGGTLRTTCRNTKIKAGHRQNLPVQARVDLSVQEGRFVSHIHDVRFRLPSSNYEVDGPEECSGDLGFGSLMRYIVESTLENARDRIEDRVKDRVKAMNEDVANRLTEIAHQRFELDLTNNLPVGEGKLVAATKPTRLLALADRLQVALGIDLELGALEKRYNKTSRAFGSVGAIGIDPRIVGEAIYMAMGEGRGTIPLTEDQVPQIREVLAVSSLGSIWPDLLEQELTEDHLRLRVGLLSQPRLAVVEGSGALKLSLDLLLRFVAPLREGWTDYFDLKVRVDANARAEDSRGGIRIDASEVSSMEVGGEWHQGYQPRNSTFEQDVAEFVVSTLLDYLVLNGPLADLPRPEVDLYGQVFYGRGISGNGNYLRMDVFGN